jgi:hypothetical protein
MSWFKKRHPGQILNADENAVKRRKAFLNTRMQPGFQKNFSHHPLEHIDLPL